MEVCVTKTIEDYREECHQSRQFYASSGLHPSSAHQELASKVLGSLAKTCSAALFGEVEEEVRRMILRDLRHYRRTGQRELWCSHADRYRDGRSEARAAIATLAGAGLVPHSMTHIAVPVPMFRGMELIRGMEPLDKRLACHDALLNVELVSLAREVPNPRAYSQRLTMSLLITEHERRDVDGQFYDRVPVRSCIATFALHKHVSVYFWPRFSLGFVFRFTVVQERRSRGQTALVVKLDMGDKGRLCCRDMELLELEEISCAWED
ncbi:hypothetical protein IV454_24315 [Massilia antarctica]|uniref:Uncharacterized protein n=1 Tax=Massilia antarctica TaxID=2765360 RepID=A0AA48WBT0_9BURK|nr:hypothetical protein [Massilia antarctica]QPI48622.1 hypothetical protein IV454_24315 [Massilia antarctica]